MTPRVTFLMAVHNNAATVRAAVDSILHQTLPDFELLLIDDASSDGTSEILRDVTDPRVVVLTNKENLGLSRSLNRGLPLARGTYLARMDADDLSLPQRAARQVAFLDAHREFAVVGSAVETFNGAPHGDKRVVTYPADAGTVAATLLFRNALAHPAVMWRRLEFDGLAYDAAYRGAQDYGLWIECLIRGLAIANLPEVLLRYRVHASQLSSQYAEGMQQEGSVIRARLLRHLMPAISQQQVALHNAISRDQFVPDAAFVRDARAWLEKLAQHNEQGAFFDHESLMRILTGRFVTLMTFARRHALDAGSESSIFTPYIRPEALMA